MQRRHASRTTTPPPRLGASAEKLAEVRRQRRHPTPAERALWAHLRGQQLGVRFRNRHVVAGLILDFYAPSLRLGVEVDGPVHATLREPDEDRARVLAACGVNLVRVTNDEVVPDPRIALARIRDAIHVLLVQHCAD